MVWPSVLTKCDSVHCKPGELLIREKLDSLATLKQVNEPWPEFLTLVKGAVP